MFRLPTVVYALYGAMACAPPPPPPSVLRNMNRLYKYDVSPQSVQHKSQ